MIGNSDFDTWWREYRGFDDVHDGQARAAWKACAALIMRRLEAHLTEQQVMVATALRDTERTVAIKEAAAIAEMVSR